MGNDINCCRAEGENTEIVTLNESKVQVNSMENIKAKSGVSANYLLKDFNNEYDDTLRDGKKNEFAEIKEEQENELFNNDSEIENPFEKKEIVERDGSFPLCTEEYCYNLSTLDKYQIDLLIRSGELIYDKGTLTPGKSFYRGCRNQVGQMHGYGTLTMSDGSRYTGLFVKNEFNLVGRLVDTELHVKEGEFSDGFLNGHGREITFTYEYKGTFRYGSKHGQGRMITELEDFTGNFDNDHKDGHGSLVFLKTGNRYEGNFQNGKIEGTGVFTWANNDTYEGTFENGILHGQGCYRWQNGDVYEGQYENGLRQGNGKLTSAAGKIYEGEFFNNLPHGKGVITKLGKRSEVVFENGAPISKSKTIVSSN